MCVMEFATLERHVHIKLQNKVGRFQKKDHLVLI